MTVSMDSENSFGSTGTVHESTGCLSTDDSVVCRNEGIGGSIPGFLVLADSLPPVCSCPENAATASLTRQSAVPYNTVDPGLFSSRSDVCVRVHFRLTTRPVLEFDRAVWRTLGNPSWSCLVPHGVVIGFPESPNTPFRSTGGIAFP